MEPTFVHSNSVAKDTAYQQWFSDLKSRLRSHQVKAAMHVNTEMLEFYWSLGRDLVQKKAETQWGSGVVEQLSLDLKDAFPGVKGFSTTNIWYSKKWYLFYSEEFIKLQQSVGEISMPKEFGAVPWGQHILIITKCQSVEEALFYVNKVIEEGWSRRRLEDELATNLYARQGKAITNFSMH